MEYQMNVLRGTSLEKEMRKCQTTLMVTGAGVIIFEIWSMVRIAALAFLSQEGANAYLGIETQDAGSAAASAFFLIFFFAVDFVIRLYVGLSARGEARGKRKRSVYLILAGSIAFFYFAAAAGGPAACFLLGGKAEGSMASMLASSLLDLTAGIMTVKLISAGIRVRRLRREQQRQREM